ncbi:hypothetical protein AOL_s00210g94 [Orbilia oligospora ATCC 24927]|uniref:F-box domain-containing protein n=1 Tax=Arthrobotrys oligospora (strain ATCC 24927 / CBS 115.81 / DSM 1491) TaxID=756982 RepID=G1XRT6_ARTOA|nr:hypothetical protein AOL_s00210g94 [Orbilia oligospora ATCC 24927]EGX44113.1 hypothetical protein AOL_s00210g94 [Orbilia oligospora ATCC 24927]
MASLVGLSQAPETLYLILEYLENKDLFSLLLTCKSLYPACYCELWSMLGFGGFNPINPTRRTVSSKGYARFRDAIDTFGADNLGFKYTKFLGLGASLFQNKYRRLGLGKKLGDLLETGKLAPRVVRVRLHPWGRCSLKSITASSNMSPGIFRYNWCDTKSLEVVDIPQEFKEEVGHILVGLKTYSKTKSPEDLSISLQTELVHSIPQLFDLEKITTYELAVYFYERGRKKSWSTPDSHNNIGDHILELKSLLAGMTNLKHFSWNMNFRSTYRDVFLIEKFATEFDELQAVFTKMQYLESLALLDYLFHPSFFLIPPKTVKKLEYGGNLSNIWWRRFAKYPFIGVEDLFIHAVEPFKGYPTNGFLPPDSIEDVNTLLLGEVAITGLKKCTLGICDEESSSRPLDLGECILQKNRDLEHSISNAIAENRAHMLVLRAYSKISDKLFDYSSLITHKYTPKFVESAPGDESRFNEQIKEECTRALLHGSKPVGLEDWKAARTRAREFAQRCQFELQNKLFTCIDMVSDDYALRLANGEDLDRSSFEETCFKMFSKGPNLEDVRKLTDARNQASRAVSACLNRFRVSLNDKDDKEQFIKMYKEKDFQIGDAEIESAVDRWTRKMIENIEEGEESGNPPLMMEDDSDSSLEDT